MYTRMPTPTAAVVRAQLVGVDLRTGLLERATRRLDRLRDDDEQGAQAAEYAMLGGVSAAVCAALIALLRQTDIVKTLVDAVIGGLIKAVRSWF